MLWNNSNGKKAKVRTIRIGKKKKRRIATSLPGSVVPLSGPFRAALDRR